MLISTGRPLAIASFVKFHVSPNADGRTKTSPIPYSVGIRPDSGNGSTRNARGPAPPKAARRSPTPRHQPEPARDRAPDVWTARINSRGRFFGSNCPRTGGWIDRPRRFRLATPPPQGASASVRKWTSIEWWTDAGRVEPRPGFPVASPTRKADGHESLPRTVRFTTGADRPHEKIKSREEEVPADGTPGSHGDEMPRPSDVRHRASRREPLNQSRCAAEEMVSPGSPEVFGTNLEAVFPAEYPMRSSD